MNDGPDWTVEQATGSAADFHARSVPAGSGRQIWVLSVDRPALVLGSTQDLAVVDRVAAAAAGVQVVRRRSGGGAVLLDPATTVWVDVVLPAGDPLWDDDVARSFHWLGAAWAETLGRLDLGFGAEVHGPTTDRSRWSSLVCFGGLGAGEVTVGGRKAVGLSQRRTRSSARFQCLLYRAWEPDRLLDLLALEPDDRSKASRALRDAVRAVPPPAGVVHDALLRTLRHRSAGNKKNPWG